MTRVLVLASEVVPLPGLPTNGGGLRGWTLARGLESAGFEVVLLFPRDALDALGPRIDPRAREAALAHTFAWHDPAAAVARHDPDVVVCCSWLLASHLGPCPVPLAVDAAGPVLLEFLYQDPEKAVSLAPRKPRGLALADFVTCAGERQRTYFYPWLLLAGFDQEALATRVATVPISAPPRAEDPLPPGDARSAPRPPGADPTIIFAGLVLPWQDPRGPLGVLLETLQRRGRGRLEVYATEHPTHSQGAAWFGWLRERAWEGARVTIHDGGPWPYAELLARCRRADLAFDLFARNPERELAVATRTVDYLACGLPVLHSDYAELAGAITSYDAGFVVDPADPAAVAAAVERALDEPERLSARRANARRLVDERLTWGRTIAPLARWCAAPTRSAPGALGLATVASGLPDAGPAATSLRGQIDRLHDLAVEREAYALRLEAAWAEQGARLAMLDGALGDCRRSPWRAALRQTLGALRGRLGRRRGVGA